MRGGTRTVETEGSRRRFGAPVYYVIMSQLAINSLPLAMARAVRLLCLIAVLVALPAVGAQIAMSPCLVRISSLGVSNVMDRCVLWCCPRRLRIPLCFAILSSASLRRLVSPPS